MMVKQPREGVILRSFSFSLKTLKVINGVINEPESPHLSFSELVRAAIMNFVINDIPTIHNDITRLLRNYEKNYRQNKNFGRKKSITVNITEVMSNYIDKIADKSEVYKSTFVEFAIVKEIKRFQKTVKKMRSKKVPGKTIMDFVV